MWVMLNDSFLSIVHKDCAPDELLVRARRKGDIERLFPRSKVTVSEESDYRFRAVVNIANVQSAIALELTRITYPNFKDSVKDKTLHDAYLNVWAVMHRAYDTYRGAPGYTKKKRRR